MGSSISDTECYQKKILVGKTMLKNSVLNENFGQIRSIELLREKTNNLQTVRPQKGVLKSLKF